MDKQTKVGRLAFRREGAYWNAYWAPNEDNLDGACLMGNIMMVLVEGYPEIRNLFMDVMRRAFEETVGKAHRGEITWAAPKQAPESERAGHG